jgi:hypothetical protein
MERRLFFRILGLGGTATAVATISGVLRAGSAHAAPPGQPFQDLQRQIDELARQLGDGTFEVLRVLNPNPGESSTLFFGPTDDCSIGIDPVGGLTGLIERDPVGFRLIGPGGQGCRLIFGPTMDCTVEVDPDGPAGLLLRDPDGIRVLNPEDPQAARLLWGPTDECSIGLDPALTGLVERDPIGFRLLGRNDQGCRLLFGPTDLCTVEVDPAGPAGLLLRDPDGIRVLNPDPAAAPTLLFGPSDDCAISIGADEGMIFVDPRGFQFENPEAPGEAQLRVDGNVEANEFIQTSSGQLKENVVPLDDALDRIQRLQGVRFNWKPELGGEASIGFIAEDVAEVLPELVSRRQDGSASGLSYGNMVAVALEGIKAQQTTIEEQQTKMEQMQAENLALHDEIDQLRAQIDDTSAKLRELMSKLT